MDLLCSSPVEAITHLKAIARQANKTEVLLALVGNVRHEELKH